VGEALVNQVTFFFFFNPYWSTSNYNDNSWPKYSVGLSLFFRFSQETCLRTLDGEHDGARGCGCGCGCGCVCNKFKFFFN